MHLLNRKLFFCMHYSALSLLYVHIFNLGDWSWWVTWAKTARANFFVPVRLWVGSIVSSMEIMSRPWKKSGSELDDARPPPITDAPTELKMEIVPKFKVTTQLRAQVPRLTISEAMLTDVNIDLCKEQHRGSDTSTRSTEAGVYHSPQDPHCRLCKNVLETFQHKIF